MSYHLTDEAAEDVHDIWMYGYEEWGTERADSYLLGLEQSFFKIASHPEVAPVKYQVHKNIRVYHHRKHYIFYFPREEDIIIVAVFHEKMDMIKRIRSRL